MVSEGFGVMLCYVFFILIWRVMALYKNIQSNFVFYRYRITISSSKFNDSLALLKCISFGLSKKEPGVFTHERILSLLAW